MSESDSSSQIWIGNLVKGIAAGRQLKIAESDQLDRLLSWLAGHEGPLSELIDDEFSHLSITNDKAKKLTLAALDEYLFSNDDENPLRILGFSHLTDRESLKTRYRRLIQIYHPDRAISQGAWLNDRAERLNRAYKTIQNYGPDLGSPESIHSTASAVKPTVEDFVVPDNGRSSVSPASIQVRTLLGSSDGLKRKAFLVLGAGALLFITTIYFSSNESADFASVKSSSSQKENEIADIKSNLATDDPTSVEATIAGESIQASSNELTNSVLNQAQNEVADNYVPDVNGHTVSSRLENKQFGEAEIAHNDDPNMSAANGLSGYSEETNQLTAVTIARPYLEIPNDRIKRSLPSAPENNEESLNKNTEEPQAIENLVAEQNAEVAEIKEEKVRPKEKVSETELETTAKQTQVLPSETQASDKNFSADSAEDTETKPKAEIVASTSKPKIVDKTSNLTTPKKLVQRPVAKHLRKPKTFEKDRAKTVLENYVDGIRFGDIDKVSASLSEEIQINTDVKSKDQLLSEYQQLFSNTKARSYTFLVNNWAYMSDQSVKVSGSAEIRYEYRNSPNRIFKGPLEYYIFVGNGDAKLVEITFGR